MKDLERREAEYAQALSKARADAKKTPAGTDGSATSLSGKKRRAETELDRIISSTKQSERQQMNEE